MCASHSRLTMMLSIAATDIGSAIHYCIADFKLFEELSMSLLMDLCLRFTVADAQLSKLRLPLRDLESSFGFLKTESGAEGDLQKSQLKMLGSQYQLQPEIELQHLHFRSFLHYDWLVQCLGVVGSNCASISNENSDLSQAFPYHYGEAIFASSNSYSQSLKLH